MTADEKIQHLDERVTKIEDEVWNKLDTIGNTCVAIQLQLAKQSHCPAPGKCLQLDTALGSAVLRIERLELKSIELDKWRSLLSGAWIVSNIILAAGIGVLVAYIVKHL